MEVTAEQWEYVGPTIKGSPLHERMAEEDPGVRTERCSTASCYVAAFRNQE